MSDTLTAEDIIKVGEACKLLGISQSALYRGIERNIIPHIRLGSAIRLRRSTLTAWVREQEARAMGGGNHG